MQIDGNTNVSKLIEAHPYLVDFLAGYSKGFQLLQNPVMRKTMARFANLSKASALAGVPLPELLEAVAGEIRRQTGGEVTVAEGAAPEAPDAEDRLDALRAIIEGLHAGVPMEEARRLFQESFQDVDPAEIAAMEQELTRWGMPPEEIRRLCDVHVAVFKEALDRHEGEQAPPGHPVHTYQRENAALAGVIDEIRGILSDSAGPEALLARRDDLRAALARLGEVEKHYQRKENQLFPYLEKYGISAPPKVMWAVHDDIRAQFKAVGGFVDSADGAALAREIPALLTAVEDMIYKEENILFPLTLQILSPDDWFAMHGGEAAIGFALVQPEGSWAAPTGDTPAPATAAGMNTLPLDTGLLSLEQVNLLLTHLPVDLTFVDENDTVRYYSEGKERVFPRSPGIIGREVQNCHPPKSLHMVNQILDAFRRGEREVAEFWFESEGRFLHIRYFALRDARGPYRGCLEVSQDVTGIRALRDERRLLQWE